MQTKNVKCINLNYLCTLNAPSYLCMGTFAGRDLALLSDSLWGDTERERWCVDLCCSGTSSVIRSLSLSLSLSRSLPRSLSFSLGRLSAAVSTQKHIKHALVGKKITFLFKYSRTIQYHFKYSCKNKVDTCFILFSSFPASTFVHETVCSINSNIFFSFVFTHVYFVQKNVR